MVEGSVLQGFVPALRVDPSYDIPINISLYVTYTDNIQGQSEWEGRGWQNSQILNTEALKPEPLNPELQLEMDTSTLRSLSSVTDALV